MGRIMMSKYFNRKMSEDFSDDGAYFKMYELETPEGNIEVSYLKDDGQVYISPRGYELKGDMTYNELKNSCPSYMDLDMFNGVHETKVDLQKLVEVCYQFIREVNTAKKQIKPVDTQLVMDYIKKYNDKLDSIKKQVKDTINLDYILSFNDKYTRNALVEGYESMMKSEHLDLETFMKRGRSYIVDIISKDPYVYTPYYIGKYVFHE